MEIKKDGLHLKCSNCKKGDPDVAMFIVSDSGGVTAEFESGGPSGDSHDIG